MSVKRWESEEPRELGQCQPRDSETMSPPMAPCQEYQAGGVRVWSVVQLDHCEDEKRSGREGSEAVDHGSRKEREEQGDCVMMRSGREVPRMYHERLSRTCKLCGNIGSVLRMRTQQLGAKEEARRT